MRHLVMSFWLYMGGNMGSRIKVAFATVAIICGSLSQSVHAQEYRRVQDTSGSQVTAPLPGGAPLDKQKCADLLRQLNLKASQVLAFYKLYGLATGSLVLTEAKLREELARPFILYNKDEVARLKLEIAKLKQQIKLHRDRHAKAVLELRELEELFFSTAGCGDIYGYDDSWREAQLRFDPYIWSPIR